MIRLLTLPQNEGVSANSFIEQKEEHEAIEWIQHPKPQTLFWIDITKQTPAYMDLLAKSFSFHPLALEDCLHFDQRPKLEEFPGINPHLFLVIHQFSECTKEQANSEEGILSISGEALSIPSPLLLRSEELHAFLGPNYLVTIHEHPISPLEQVWNRIAKDPASFSKGCDFLYYQIADALCDSNFPILDRLSDLLDHIEEQVIENPKRNILTSIYETRKALVFMRKTLSPQRDLMALLARHGGNSYIRENTALYFRDIYDHLVRINESIESGRDLLGNCVDSYLSSVGQRTNEIMKQLTILSAIMLPLTFLSGFFGMNFDTLIPFHSKPLFISLLLVMFAVLPISMIAWFRKKGWI